MPLPRLRFCLMITLLASAVFAQPAPATEAAPAAVGTPLDLVPAKPRPRPAKRVVAREKHYGRGRSPLIEPETPSAPESVHETAAAATPGVAPPATPHATETAAPGSAHPASSAETSAGIPAARTPVAADATPPEHAEPRQAAMDLVAPRPVAALKGPAEQAVARPAPLPAAPVVPVTTTTPGETAPATPATLAARPAPQNDTQQYCSNIAAAAADARFAWQRKQITDLEAQLKQRVAELDAKQADVTAVLARRDAVMKKATDTVVALYAGMKPDAAAEQIASLDDEMAAALLAQLPQRKASLILNQMTADKAAKLVAVIATVAPPEKKS